MANLLLVHSVARRREIAIRLSLGVTRTRLIRQLLVESLLLGLLGGALAVLLTFWTARTFATFIPPSNLPIALDGRMDCSVLVAACAISLLTAAVFGTLPALRTSRLAPSGSA